MRGESGAIVDISDLGIIPRILFATDGAISHILEAYADEPVDLVVLSSSSVADASGSPELRAVPSEPAMRRVSVLQGRRSGRVFVHADAIFLLGRLPRAVADELTASATSLLKVLARHRIASFREGVAEWEGTDAAISAAFAREADAALVARTYQIVVGGRPVALITESFPTTGFT